MGDWNLDFNFQVNRHDHHNFEFKFNIESSAPAVEGRAEIYLFLPQTLRLAQMAQSDLMSDFHSRVRLSLPREWQTPATLDRARQEFSVALETVAASVDEKPLERAWTHESWLQEVKQFGSAVGEVLKRQRSRHKKRLAKVPSQIPIDVVLNEMKTTCDSVVAMQQLLTSERLLALPYLPLLEEYIAHLFIQYLGALDPIIRAKVLDAAAHPSWQAAGDYLTTVAQQITSHPRWVAGRSADYADETRRSELLLRISQMKKFFQSNMFVEVSSRQLVKRFTEPAAAAAAGFAALWATAFQQFSQPSYMRFGLSGLTFLCLGIAAYILKDRIKDRGRAFLTSKASKFLPDVEQLLSVEDKPIGYLREWFSVGHYRSIPDAVRQLRLKHSLSAAEAHLGEDVLCYENHFHVKGRGVRSSLRVNLDRHLKHLDDPVKAMTRIEPCGLFSRVPTHRIYYFYVVARVHSRPSEKLRKRWRRFVMDESGTERIYRVVMDKQGIQSVVRLNNPVGARMAPGLLLIPIPGN